MSYSLKQLFDVNVTTGQVSIGIDRNVLRSEISTDPSILLSHESDVHFPASLYQMLMMYSCIAKKG
jgi:hypothetical protein